MKMKSVLISLIPILILISCGGSGDSQESSTSLQPSNSISLPTAVIDGYVSGANVYIDFNWNLVQDEGEPSATENTSQQLYEFSETDFSEINNFSAFCGMNRPRIAEVPIGAVDSENGTVTEAYTMTYFPRSYNSNSERANVTPFSSLFTVFVQDAIQGANITVPEACGSEADDIAVNVLGKVESVLNDLEYQYGINPSYFYEDYIASGNAEKQEIGEKIVVFLGTMHEVEKVAEEIYGSPVVSYPSEELINTILAGNEFNTLTFHIVIKTTREIVDSYFSYEKRLRYNNIVANDEGQILDSNGNPMAITQENLETVADVHSSEDYESGIGNVVNGYFVHISTEINNGVERTFILFSKDEWGCDLTLSKETTYGYLSARQGCYPPLNTMDQTELRLYDETNPYFDYDVSLEASRRDVATINDIFEELDAIPLGIANRDNALAYVLDGDQLFYEIEKDVNWFYYYTKGSGEELCQKIPLGGTSVIQSWTGTTAYEQCYANMQ